MPNDSAYRRKRRQRLKEHLDSVKLSRGCRRCGYAEDVRALDFAHRNPQEKSFSLGRTFVMHVSWERMLAEVEKCDVLCSNCHRIETAEFGHYYTRRG